MNEWLPQLAQLVASGTRCMMVCVAHTAGSTPREPGSRMLVTADVSFGSIGGGNLEYQAIALARRRIAGASGNFTQRIPLGPTLGQCCGGVVDLAFIDVAPDGAEWIAKLQDCVRRGESAVLAFPMQSGAGNHPMLFTAGAVFGSLPSGLEPRAAWAAAAILQASPPGQSMSLLGGDDAAPELLIDRIGRHEFHVALFGAGHVGKAIVAVLSGALPCRITWVDDRVDQFPATLPANVDIRTKVMALDEVGRLPGGSCVLVMTHSHALDQAICAAVLRRDDFAFLGLIGSATKRRRFTKRLRELGHGELQLQRLVCPIGIPGIHAKRPEAIAVAVAAQLLQLHEQRAAAHTPRHDGASVQSL